MKNKLSLLSVPYVVWMALFVVAPIIMVVIYAFTATTGGFTLENFSNMGTYAVVFGRSFRLALIATVKSLGLGAIEGSFVSNLWMVLGVFGGCMLWWTVLAIIVSLVRRKFRPSHILWINRIAGSAITLLGISLIFSAITHNYLV